MSEGRDETRRRLNKKKQLDEATNVTRPGREAQTRTRESACQYSPLSGKCTLQTESRSSTARSESANGSDSKHVVGHDVSKTTYVEMMTTPICDVGVRAASIHARMTQEGGVEGRKGGKGRRGRKGHLAPNSTKRNRANIRGTPVSSLLGYLPRSKVRFPHEFSLEKRLDDL